MIGETVREKRDGRRLLAVTICINYADYLECIIENRGHFDRWIVMTVPNDTATQALCEKHGIECHDSAVLQPDGKDFHAVFNKGVVINEGIELLLAEEKDDEAWCVILDADVLLPRHFGERVRAMPLEAGVLYGTVGRKVCETREQFEMLKKCEPWERLVAKNSQALGYFNLFSLAATPNRYPARTTENIRKYDDYLFTTSFLPDRRRMLPFAALHLGKFGVNWHGRMSERYETRKRGEGLRDLSDGIQNLAFDKREGTAAVLGYFPNGRWQDVANGYSKVILVDDFRVHPYSADPIVEADRSVLRRIFDEQVSGLECVELLETHTLENVAKIPDDSLDLLYLSGEASPESLCSALPHWLPKLQDGAVICGDAYGLPHWPDATYTLAILLGIPDELAKDGCWRKRYRASARPLPRVRGDGSEEGDGIIVLSGGTGSMESLLMSVHSVRKHWSGSIQVWHQGPEDESLRLVCTRLGIEFFPICAKIRATEEFTNEACHGTRFRRTLILKPGQVLIGSPQFENGSDPVVRDRTGPMLVSRTDQIFTLRSGACIAGAEFDETREETILLGDGKSDHWSEAAWEKWCQIETEATEFNVTEIRVAPNSTVVTVVTPEEAGDFQRNWLTWRFRGASALVVLVDIAPEEFWLPGSESARILPVSGKDAADLVSLLGMISETCDTERVLLLPPLAAALPGAELWADLPDGWSAVHYPEFTRREVDITGNRFTPRNCFVLAPKNELKAIATRQPDGRLLNLSRIVIEWAGEREAQGGQVMFSNMAEFGWRFPAVCFLGNEPHRKWQPNDAIIRQHGDGRLQLADDVVVISLPERADRRKRMSEALDSWRVKFRFVDGVRLTDEEVDPNEVADVELDEWKRYVSEQKFLRGTAGCRRAHLRCFEEAYRSGVNSLLLIEDDMQFVDGWLDRYIAALAELPEGWLQLYLSGSDFLPSVPVSTNLHRLAGAYQTTAILYSEAGIEAALNALRVSRCEIDVWMARHLHPFGNSYAIRPDITYQDGGVSDILSFDRGVTP